MPRYVFYVCDHRPGKTAYYETEASLISVYPATEKRITGEGVTAPELENMLGPFFRPVRGQDEVFVVTYETREHRVLTSR
jgi:hypothetical protein